MLRQDEYDHLLAQLGDYLATGDSLSLLNPLPPGCRIRIQRDLRYPVAYAQEALKVCIADRWNNNPCWLALLIQMLQPESRTQEILRRIENPPQAPDPIHARVLITGTAFVNRHSLRKSAVTLKALRTVRPILVVDGPERSGKTFTGDYVEHLYHSGCDFLWVRLSSHGVAHGPDKVARDILDKLGVPRSRLSPNFFERDTNNVRWTFDLAGAVLTEGLQFGKQVWIILDDFRGTNAAPDTLTFIDGLAQQILASSRMLETYRLILTDFDRANLTVHNLKIASETITPFADSDVFDCVKEMSVQAGRNYTDEEITTIVNRIVADLPDNVQRMEHLNGLLGDLRAAMEADQ